MDKDLAEIGALSDSLAQIGKALDQYLKFEHADAHGNQTHWKSILNQTLPETGIGLNQTIKQLTDVVIPNGSPVTNPGFSSFITTGATTVSTLASTAANIASPQRYLGTAFNYLEELSLEWLAELCGVPNLKGVYSSGGSVANLVALGGARQFAYESRGVDPAADGMDVPGVIYASEECHHTIQRSAGVLGLGRNAVKLIPHDKLGRIDFAALEKQVKSDHQAGICQVAISANAGSTNRGSIDPLLPMGELAKSLGIWFHVDGAYGLPGILDDRVKPLYQGLELADSVIVDPHKWLGASVGVAATLVKDRGYLLRAFTQEPADYLEGSALNSEQTQTDDRQAIEHSLDDFGIPYFDYGVELSAPCRGVVVWALILEIGKAGMQRRVVRHNSMAREIETLCEAHPNLEVLSPATLSICCFRYYSDEISDLDAFNQRLHRRLIRENQYMPSTTRVDGKLAIRPCFVGARAEFSQAKALVDAVIRIGDALFLEINQS